MAELLTGRTLFPGTDRILSAWCVCTLFHTVRGRRIAVCVLHRFTGGIYQSAAHYQQDGSMESRGFCVCELAFEFLLLS